MQSITVRPPLCFALMPFGRKVDPSGRVTDFDSIYRHIIAPAVQQAGLEPIRADEEKVGGTIHKPMFERLMLCDYAIADITGTNANVFYELGIRHAIRPRSTVIIFAEGTVLPFDVAPLRAISYRVDENGAAVHPQVCASRIAEHLAAARMSPHDDSPLYQLLDYMPRFEVDHRKTDIFRERLEYSKEYKARLSVARASGAQAVKVVMCDPSLTNLQEVEVGIVVDLFLSLREVECYSAMVELYHRMPEPVKRMRMVREQYAFALNREGNSQEAETVLKETITEFGPSSETNGLLGRVYKDRWMLAKRDNRIEARALLRKAIDAYLAGFESDWRDAYPGINALALMDIQGKPEARRDEILPVVRYAALQKVRRGADYWDHATLLELAVIVRDREDAQERLADAFAGVSSTAPWQLRTTARNLSLIREAREQRAEETEWIKLIEDALEKKCLALGPDQE
jgi:hypothetical protein